MYLQKTFLLLLYFLLASTLTFAQHEHWIHHTHPHTHSHTHATKGKTPTSSATITTACPGNSNVLSSEYGDAFTPRGDFNMLVIYAGFVGQESESTRQLSGWSNRTNTNGAMTPDLPDYLDYDASTNTYSTASNFFNRLEDFNPGGPIDEVGNKSLSRIFNIMSQPNENFRMTGEVFTDPNGVPAMVVVDPYIDPMTGQMWTNPCDFPDSWSEMNRLVIQNASLQNPNFDWNRFDQRENSPAYICDNSDPANPDTEIDYICIIYKYLNNGNWDAADVPDLTQLVGSSCGSQNTIDQSSWQGSGGGIGSVGIGTVMLPSGPISSLTFGPGITITIGINSHEDLLLHESTHAIYDCPHFFSGNNVAAPYLNRHTAGWGGTAQTRIFHTLTAWERWYLGYITPVEPSQNSIITLEDFITTGRAIRIEVPNSGGQYLWIENHTGNHDLDTHGDFGKVRGPNGEAIGDSPAGIYMYIEDIAGDKSETGVAFSGSNGAKFINASGNYDFFMDLTAPPISDVNNFSLLPVKRLMANPISGGHPGLNYRDDFDGDNDIDYSTNSNGGGTQEHRTITRETVNGMDKFLYRHTLGDTEIVPGYNDNPIAFQEGDVVGIATNPTIFNYADYSFSARAFNPTILNGLRIEVLEIDANGTARLDIRFDEVTLDKNLRWTGNIALPNISGDAGDDLIIDAGKTLTLDLSGTVNRHQPHPTLGGFVNPTVMTIGSDAVLHMLESSNLTIKSGSTLIIEDGAEVILENGACIVVEEDGFLDLRGNNIQLNGSNALISVRGTLITADGVDFTFKGDGYADFYENHVLQMGTGSNFVLQRNSGDPGFGERFILLQDNTELQINDRDLTLQGGKVIYQKNAQLTAINTAVDFSETTFTDLDNGVISDNSSTGFEGIDLVSCLINKCTFEYFDLGMDISGNTTVPDISNSFFTRNNRGLRIGEMDEINLTANQIKFNGLEGLRIERVDVANINSNFISNTPLGCMLDQVRFAYFSGTQVSDCSNIGVHANSSNVFLNENGTISNNNIGVFFSKTPAPLFSLYMLSVGKCSCGNIINNQTGVKGSDIILDIDIPEHSFECNPTDLAPNRFDGNTEIFDICYSFQLSQPILMRGNYWGGQNIGSNYTIESGNGSFCGLANIPIVSEPFASNIGACSNLPGIIDPSTPNLSFAQEDSIRCEFVKGQQLVEVHQQSRLAFYDLYQKDYSNAKLKYTPVADLNPITHNTANCNNKIYIARCITEAIDNDQFSNPRSDWEQAAKRYNPFQRKDIAIYPNPAQSSFTIESKKSGEKQLRMYDLYGRLVLSLEFNKQKEIDIATLSKGVYILEISSIDKSQVVIEKVIVE